MMDSKLDSLSIVSVLILVAAAPVLSFASAPATAATNSDTADTYVVEQGDECVLLEPHGDGTETVEEFYDYRTPYTEPSAWDYSSYGTENLQDNQVSKVFVHEGSDGTSLVFLHDKREDTEPQPYGSTITMELSDLPEGEWAVRDDTYDNNDQDDDWDVGDSSAAIDWKWQGDRSDGGAYRGLHNMDAEDAITVDPSFNEEADHWNDWNWSGDEDNRTESWVARSGDGTETELDMSEPITVERGICGEDETAPDANATVSPTTVAPGADVTFDARESTDNLDIERYEWDFGDGTEAVTGETVTHAYAESGTYEATLTVTDGTNNTDTTTVPVTVEAEETEAPDEPPTAALDAPGSVTAGETAAFDASDSTDDHEIVEYQWQVDGSSVDAEGPTLERTFSDAGNHTVGVTVVDGSDQTNATTATVRVEADSDEAPTAEASADPTTVAPDESIEFDATASTDDGEITAYEWEFGDGNTSDGATASHAYAGTGDYEVTLTVTDDANNTNTTTVPVSVEAEETEAPDRPPTADLTADLTATDSVAVGDPVTFDASGSTDDAGIVEYQWSVDGSSVDDSGETLEQSFVTPGDHTVTVTAVDGADQTNSSSANVTVEALDDGSNEEDDSGDGDEGDGNESDEGDDTGDSDDSDDSNTGDESDESDSPDDTDDSDDSTGDSPSSGGPSSGSPSSGGSSGGTGGAAPPADESSSASVSQADDGRLVVTVENAVAGESVSADVPGDENATGLRSVELVPATDADELAVTLVPGGVRAPNGTDTGLYEIRTENGSTVRNVTYRLAVDRADVGESGEPRILAGDGSDATAVNHTVVANGSTTVVEATTAGVNRVVVAAVAPDVSATAIGTDGTATAGEPATVEATLANDGHLAANRSLNLSVDGAVVDSRNVTVPAGGTANVSFETTFDAGGDARLSVAGTEGTVSVTSADDGTDTEGATDTEGDADDQSTDTESTDAAPSSSQNTELALAGFGILVIGAAGLIRIL